MHEETMQPSEQVEEREIRDSIRVINRDRTTRFILVIAAAILGISALLVTAYLGS